MSHDIPDSSVEIKTEVPQALREFLARDNSVKFEATPEEVEDFNRFMALSTEELEVERYNLKAEVEKIAWELIEATGVRYEELDALNTQAWRKVSVCMAAFTVKQNKQ